MPTRFKAALFVILLLGVFARAHRLGDKIFWIDEGISWHVASFKTVGEIIRYNSFEQHSPLPQIIDHYWVKAVGDSMAALHLESLIWSVAALGVFTLTAFWMLSWEAAFGAVSVLSLSAYAPEFAQMFRYPSLGMFVASLWLLGFAWYRKSGRLAAVLLYAASLALSAHVHLYAIFTIIALTIFVLVARKSIGRSIWPLLAAHAGAIAAIAPKFSLMREMGLTEMAKLVPLQAALSHLETLPVGGIVRIFLSFCAGRAAELETLTVPFAALILLLFGLVLLNAFFHKKYSFEAWLCALLLAVPVFLGWMGMVFRGIYFHSAYYVPLYLLFCLMLGIGADRLRQWRPLFAPLLLAAYFVFSFFFLHLYWSRLDRPENIKTLLAYVSSHAGTGDFVTLSPPYTFNFNYYWKGHVPVHDFSDDYNPATTPHNNLFLLTSPQHQINDARMLRWERDVASHYNRVWMFWVLGEKNTEDRAGFARKWLDGHYEKLETRRYRMLPYMNDYTGEVVLYKARKPVRQ